MKREIERIDPLSAGVMLGAFGAVLALLRAAVFLLWGETADGFGVQAEFGQLGPLLVVFLPLTLAVGGFAVGIVFAWLYNGLARLLGGIVLTVRDKD